jgi:O-antigen/teichoic acid export membrane protein
VTPRKLITYLGPLKEIAWVALGQTIAFLGGLVGIKLLTNMMPPENYGELALGLTLAGVVNLFFFGPLGQVALRFYSACRERGNIIGFTRVLIRLHWQAILLLTAISLPFLFFVGVGFGSIWVWLFALALLFGIFSGIQGTLLSLLGALRDRKMGAVTQGLDTWLRLGFAIALMAWMGSQGYWAIFGYALGALIIVVIQLRAVRRHGFQRERLASNERQDGGLRDEFFSYGLPFVAFAGLASISQYADRWLLQSFWSTGEVGIYAVMFQIASAPIVFLMGVATQLIIPVVFSRSGNLENRNRTQSSQSLLSRSVIVVGMLYFIVTLVTYVWGETLIAWLTNADYSLYASSLWLIVLSQALFNLAQFMVASGLSLNRPKAYFIPKLGQTATLLLAGTFLVRNGGIEGMAQALLFSSTVYFIWVVTVNIRLWRVHVGENAKLG